MKWLRSEWQWFKLSICFCLHFLTLHSIQAQCIVSGPISIPDQGTQTVSIQVSGLTDVNLSSPTQGICGVEIHFEHEYVGDLVVTLISPAGTQVTLIGPLTAAISPTNLTQWNIDFVPCGNPASPDAGFTDVWSNDQSWSALAMYNGSYYPNTGCLEDFNTGPANGTWQIRFSDQSEFQLGSVTSVSLIFCNPDGLECQTCTANGGTLSPSGFNLCAGESFQSTDVSIDFGGNVPSVTDYEYVYALVSGNSIQQYGTSFVSILPEGDYSLCGLSYFRGDENTVNALLAAGDFDILQQSALTGIFCGDFSDNCIDVRVVGPPDTVIVHGTICQGDMFVFRGTPYSSVGTYYQSIDGPGLCDTIAEIRISPGTLSVMSTQDAVINCGDNSISLNAIATGTNAPVTFQWNTTSGNIISDPALSMIQVNQAGLYTVEATDGVCFGNGSSEVLAGPGFPQVIVSGGTLTCTRTVIPLRPVFVPVDAVIQWVDPLGNISTNHTLDATIPGNYVLSVTNQNGCTTVRPIEILIDTTTAPVTIIETLRDCANMRARLNIQTTLNVVARMWTGPNSFESPTASPFITDPGLYQVEVVFNNGCRRTATFLFDGDFMLPDIMLPPQDTINCNEQIQLTITSGTPGVSYSWQGPNGIASNMATLSVNQPGIYTGSVVAPNHCRNSGTVEIVKGDDIFDFTTFHDTLDCNNDTVTIGVIAPDADMFNWIGIPPPGSMNSSIDVTTPGVYDVVMINSASGCQITTSIQVDANFVNPSFGFTTDTITCSNPVAELNFVPFANFIYTDIFWILPDQSVVSGPSLMSDMPGEHRLIAEGPNGCRGTWRIHIPFDTLPPVVLLEYDSIGCSEQVSLTAQSTGTNISYLWSGPGIIQQSNGIADIDLPGDYTIQVVGDNGCESVQTITVDSNYILPTYVLMYDSITCELDASLIVDHNSSLNQISWIGPSGQEIGTSDTIRTSIPGQYILHITPPNNCTVSDTFELISPSFPQLSATGDTIQCDLPLAGIIGTSDVVPVSIFWVNPDGDTISSSLMAQTNLSGTHELLVTAPNGCTSSLLYNVEIDTIPPVAMIEQIGELRCQMRDFELDGAGSTGTQLVYEWSTLGGNILSDPNQPLVLAEDTGRYQLIVLLTRNGCADTTEILIAEHPDAIQGVDLLLTPASCNGDANAIIDVVSVSGGVAPLIFSLDNSVPQLDGFFDQLAAGTYLLSLEDDEGCLYDTLVTIPGTGPYGVYAGEDAEIFLGEIVTLIGEHDLADSLLATSTWLMGDSILCSPCTDVEITPLETTTFIFSVGSETNCLRQDTVIIYVIEQGKFYIPNVFTPNGDGINDLIIPHFGNGVEEVLKWVVFDRWGQAVYGRTNFTPGDPSVAWDGTNSKGQTMNPAVFAYQVEFRLISGRVELHNGDITIVK